MNKKMTWLSVAISSSLVFTSVAMADSRQLLSSNRDWDAFKLSKDSGETECYMISVPKVKRPNSLRHGNPFITVTHKPAKQITNEFNFIAGYNFQTSSQVRVNIDRKKQDDLFTSEDGAWAYDAKQDAALIASMKRGNRMVLNATSGRGNATSYEFSLSGFTAAHNAITSACR
ncbi:invasion associated locus B family protein [Pseudemcibacter aquimaris]|uniref:invasion associated locus B family protein n=1 Tax=Pseudemcibacter aquimaris TaxID=2857064 RepID=UPI002012A428|nr:invasion associated locus B family protein [Pseudemcibacter aquimaris]MCC3862244.1 invasion associated locus B family protein [Pseudemcibacter aquimaris]WDU58996.1 invasion associated locus B family protein [Pseudemcibacter aquimaris]